MPTTDMPSTSTRVPSPTRWPPTSGPGLTATPKTLPPKYFYDARGSELFDQITRLPEYYPTRTERAILDAHVADIASADPCGDAGRARQRHVGEDPAAAAGADRRRHAAPVRAVRRRPGGAGRGQRRRSAAEFPGVEVEPVVGDFEQHLGELPRRPRRLLAFLGSTIGNLDPAQRAAFLARCARRRSVRATRSCSAPTWSRTRPGWWRRTTTPQGVTAAFNKNVLAVLDRETRRRLRPRRVRRTSRSGTPTHEWIEMRLRVDARPAGARRPSSTSTSTSRAASRCAPRSRRSSGGPGSSASWRRPGSRLAHWWTDPAGDFALSLSVPAHR